jgi:hypothetical protein
MKLEREKYRSDIKEIRRKKGKKINKISWDGNIFF